MGDVIEVLEAIEEAMDESWLNAGREVSQLSS